MVDAMQPSFVGRARELEALTGALTHVRAGQARVVLVLGEAGVGKTALLRRFLDAAPDLRVVLACGDESETRLPYGLVDQLARRCGKARAAPLVQVMADPAVDPLRIGAELLDLLGAVQATGPVAVVVDDAQWADSSSLRAMTFALRRLSSDAVLALIAARAADAATLPAGLNRLVDSECGVRLRLDGFTTEEVRELAKVVGVGQLPLQAAERLRAHTAGLPLHVAALLEELPSDVLRQLSKELPAPRSFSQLVRSRVAGCSPAATALVRAAAVLGSPSPLALAARLAELEHPVVPLDEAVDRQLLVEASADGAPGVAFPHPLVGAAIYADLGPARRTALHSRAAGLTTGEVALTHRVAATTRPDGALAAELRSAARAATGRGALSGAARQLLQAASVPPRENPPTASSATRWSPCSRPATWQAPRRCQTGWLAFPPAPAAATCWVSSPCSQGDRRTRSSCSSRPGDSVAAPRSAPTPPPRWPPCSPSSSCRSAARARRSNGASVRSR
ncbi:MAG: AAA family ATPase [Mycobacteriales bacterium]